MQCPALKTKNQCTLKLNDSFITKVFYVVIEDVSTKMFLSYTKRRALAHD